MIEIDSLYNEKIESLVNTTAEISNNTNAWGDTPSKLLTSLTILASVVTIVGIVGIVIEMRSKKLSRHRQELIIKDLVRHLFINTVLLEIVRNKIADKWDFLHPAEGVFSRFCVLDSDLKLDQINVRNNSYMELHSMSISLRNYNIAAMIAEKHLNDPTKSSAEKQYDLDVLWIRTQRLVDGFIELCEGTILNIDKERIGTMINSYYQKEKKRREKNGNPLPNFSISPREGCRSFFDEKFSVADAFDFAIRNRYDDIVLFPF